MAKNKKEYIIRRTKVVNKRPKNEPTLQITCVDYLVKEPFWGGSYDSEYRRNAGGAWDENLSIRTIIYSDFERARDVAGWLKIATGDILYDILQLSAELIVTEVKDPE
jgi:hypothetical protein